VDSIRIDEEWETTDSIKIMGYKPGSGPYSKTQFTEKEPGNFFLFSDLAAQDEIWFLNSRNKQSSLPWNTQDQRDSMPYGYIMDGIALNFAISAYSQFVTTDDVNELEMKVDNNSAHLWQVEIPENTTVELIVANDTRFETLASYIPKRHGMTGGGVGGGVLYELDHVEPGKDGGEAFSVYKGMPPMARASILNGIPSANKKHNGSLRLQKMDLPKGTNVAVRLVMNAYAKKLLANMNLGFECKTVFGGSRANYESVHASIQLVLDGNRRVQQRGNLER
jgi:hypothetical protein